MAFIDIKTRLLKFIDHWAGGPLCIALGVLHRVTHPFYRTSLEMPIGRAPRSIVVIKFFGLGSILLSSALLKSIREKYPAAAITFFTFEGNAKLVRSLKMSDEVRTIDVRNPYTLARSLLGNLIYFSFHKPEISIDLEFFSKFSTMMSYLTGAKWRVGFYAAKFWRNSLVNVPVYFNYARHILEIYGMVGKAVGVDVRDLTPLKIPVGADDEGRIAALLAEKKVSESDLLVGVNINASDLAYCRRWPKERFAEVINSLLKEYKGMKVFLTGTANEKEYTASIFRFLDGDIKERVFDVSGILSFGQFIALLKKARLFLTNDTGPFHLAKAQGTSTVSIWGPGSPDLYGPYGEEKDAHMVIYKRWPCSPCLYIYRTDAGYFCRNRAPCLDNIGSEDVVRGVKRALEGAREKRAH